MVLQLVCIGSHCYIIFISCIIIVTGNKDYEVGPYTVMFPATVTESSFIVIIFGDDMLENNETIRLNILFSLLPKHVIAGNPSQSTVTIMDNDCKLLDYR